MFDPLRLVNWYVVGQLFKSLMWLVAVFLGLWVLGHLLPDASSTAHAHVVIRGAVH